MTGPTPTLRDLADWLRTEAEMKPDIHSSFMLRLAAATIIEMEAMLSKLENLSGTLAEITRLEQELARRV